MRKVVFVSGLGHSGSTLMDLILGGHPNLIGLGEIFQVIRPGAMDQLKSNRQLCSCGSTVDDCVFWNQVAERLSTNSPEHTADRYRLLLEVFDTVFGGGFVPIDSSKYLHHLKIAASIDDLDLRILCLAKDVRAFAISQIDNAAKKNLGLIKKQAIAQFLVWYKGNREIDKYVESNQLGNMRIGYEELCLNTERIIEDVCSYLGEDLSFDMTAINSSKSHILVGNRMRNQEDKRKGISYDHRWFCRSEWLLPSLFLPHVMHYNQIRVYGNETLRNWNR